MSQRAFGNTNRRGWPADVIEHLNSDWFEVPEGIVLPDAISRQLKGVSATAYLAGYEECKMDFQFGPHNDHRRQAYAIVLAVSMNISDIVLQEGLENMVVMEVEHDDRRAAQNHALYIQELLQGTSRQEQVEFFPVVISVCEKEFRK